MVIARMLEAFHQKCVKEVTKITIESGSVFISNGTVIRSTRRRSVLNDKDEEKKDEDNPLLPKAKQREDLPILQKPWQNSWN